MSALNRLNNWNAIHAGSVAGGVGNHGYIQVGFAGCRYMAHRIAWAIYHGAWPEDQIDHINQDRTDNRILNLRSVSQTENSRNAKMPKNNTSGFTGIGWHKRDQKWAAYICCDGRQRSLGCFHDLNDAIAVRKAAERAANFHVNHGRKKA
ncbi:MAG: HNH endonuclease [Sphingomonadales bacterium]|nr:HNH endonuclease [Sphingomonadales bacterium]